MYQVDEDPETRSGTISADCPAGEYTVRVSLSSAEGVELASASAAFAIAAPTIGMAIAPDAVQEGNEIIAAMSFSGLAYDTDSVTPDYVFHADVLDSEDENADGCEGSGLAVDRNINRVDEDPEVRSGTVSAGCPAGVYTLRVSLSSADNTELASAGAGFFILRAPVVIAPPSLTALSVSHGNPAVNVALSPTFDSETLEYRAAMKVERITIAPTADAGATIAYRDGNGAAIADADATVDGQQVDLAAGSNTVRVPVSKDGLTTTYALTLFRLVTQQQTQNGASLSTLTLSEGRLSPVFASDTTSYMTWVGCTVTQITVTPATTDSGATTAFLDASDASDATLADADGNVSGHQVNLVEGANPIKVKVTAADGVTTETYTVTVTRTAEDTLLNPPASDPAASGPSSALYDVTFQGVWTTAVTPDGLPSGAHFTQLVGAVHNADVSFLSGGETATLWVEGVAENGTTIGFEGEINTAGANKLSLLKSSSGAPGPTDSTALSMVTLTTGHPRVTLTTMVAPSPDWFVGVAGLSLLNAGGNWVESLTVNLYPWDAGTEDGTGFYMTNDATAPRGTIHSIRGTGKFTTEPIATLTIARQPLPEVSIAAGPSPVTEDMAATFTLTRTGDTAARLVVAVTVSEQGDYLESPAPAEAVFNAGDREATLTVPLDDDDLDEAGGSVTATVTAAADAPYAIGSPPEATVRVTDNDLPFVRFVQPSAADRIVTEGDLLTFTMEREGDTSVSLIVDVETLTSGFDIPSALPHEVTPGYLRGFYRFLPGETRKEFRQAVFTFRGSRLTYLGGRYQHWITPKPALYRTEELTEAHRQNIESCSTNTDIADGACLGFGKPYQQYFFQSARQTVIIEAVADTVAEGTAAAVTLRRIGGPTSSYNLALVVDLDVSESGTFIDGAKPETATIPAQQDSVRLEIPTQEDEEDEVDGSITVRLLPRTADTYTSAEKYEIVPDDAPAARDFGENRVTVTVTDNDLPLITIAADADRVEEGEAAAFTLTRTDLANEAVSVTVDFSTTGNLLSGAVSAAADFAENARTAAVSVTTVEDDIVEADGSLTATLRALTGYRVGAPATVTIEDDDLVIDLALSPDPVREDGPATTVTVTATLESGARSVATLVDLTVSGSGAEGVVGFVPVAPFTLTIQPNAASGQATFTLTPVNDNVDETDETVTVSGAVAAVPSLMVNAATLALTDDDVASHTIALSLDQMEIAEDGGAATVIVTATLNAAARNEETVVNLTVSGSGDADAVDFTPVAPFTLTIPPDATIGTAMFTLTPTDDDVDEAHETITVGGAVTAVPALTVQAATLVLADDDVASDAIALSLDHTEVAEGADATTVTVTARMNAGARTVATELTVSVTGDTATAGTDFAEVISFTLTIPPDAVSGQATFSLAPTDDMIAEGPETLTVSAVEVVDTTQTPTPTPLPVSPATLTLTDDDTASMRIDLSVDRLRVVEGSPAATVMVTAMLDAGSRTVDTVLTVSVLGGTADAGDFTAVAAFPLTIAATQTSGMATFTLEPLADRLEEGDETIVVSGKVTSGPTLPVNSIEITLADVFTPSTEVVLSVKPATVPESVGSSGQLVNVSAEVNQGARTVETVIRVTVSASGVEAAVDFEPVAAFDITIPANNTGGVATFTLQAIDDDVDEEDETITLSGAIAALPGLVVNDVTLMLTDDDDAPGAATLSLDRTEFAEGDAETQVTVTATLSDTARTVATAVSVSVGGGAADTATAGTDFASVAPFPLTIPPNLKSGQTTFTLTPLDDEEDEENETATVSGVVTALPDLTVNAATLTLTDNDQRGITVSPDALVILEGESSTYTVALATQPSADVTVTVSGAAGTDLTVTGPPLTFTRTNWSQPQTVTVAVGHDADASADAAVTLTNTVSGGDYGAVSADIAVTITDDDSPALALSKTVLTLTEGGAAGTYTVALATQPSADVTVTVSGAAGTDLTLTGPPLTFTTSNWSQPQTVTVAARHDDDALADAAVTLTNTASGADYGDVSQDITVTITRAISSDATLSALALSGVSFTPTFAPGETTYTASVAYDVSSTIVTATTKHAGASVVITPVDADTITNGHQLNLDVGDTVISVEVTAEDGNTTQTYTVTVTRGKAAVTISADAAMADKGHNPVFTLTRSPSASDSLEVTVRVSESGRFVIPANEGDQTVTIPADTASATYMVRTVIDNDAWDPHSTVTAAVVAEASSPYTAGSPASASTDLSDDDFPSATAVLTVDPATANEGDSVTVTLIVTTDFEQMPHADAGAITLSTAPDTAQTADYGALSATSFTLEAADFTSVDVGGNPRYQAAYTATVAVVDDNAQEDAEDFSVSMARGSDLHTRVRLGTPASQTVTISANDTPTNAVPTFPSGTVTRRVAENAAAGQNVGDPVAAMDTDTGDELIYSLEGTDEPAFTIVRTSGQIQTKAGVTYNYEARTSYSVTVKVNDGTVDVTKAVTINVTDEQEPPGKPNAPAVSAKPGSSTELDVRWSAPANTGPPINDYDVRYRRAGTSDVFTTATHDGAGTSATVGGLDAGTAYEVQVHARNPEGVGDWSDSGTGTTGAAATTLSSDATLSELTLSGVSLIPAFRSPTTTYRATVDNSVSSTAVTAVTTHDKATQVILIGGVRDLYETPDLALGDNTIEVVVTAEDEVTTRTYEVIVHRRHPAGQGGPRVVIAASKYLVDREGGPGQGGYRERDLYVTLYNLETDATWRGDDAYNGDYATLDYVHRTDVLGADGNSGLADLDLRNDCEGPALFERNHMYMSVDREIRKVNENPENRGGGGGGDCLNAFTVTVTVWTGAVYEAAREAAYAAVYESQGREAAEAEARVRLGAAPHAAQLTCEFDGTANDDFRALLDDGDGDPQRGWDWYYQGYALCTDANADFDPDSAPTIPALNWEPPE